MVTGTHHVVMGNRLGAKPPNGQKDDPGEAKAKNIKESMEREPKVETIHHQFVCFHLEKSSFYIKSI